MKAKTFENLIRKIVREEIDYALRREIKSLKEDIREEISKEEPKSIYPPKKMMREEIMGSKPIKKQYNNRVSYVFGKGLIAALLFKAKDSNEPDANIGTTKKFLSKHNITMIESDPDIYKNMYSNANMNYHVASTLNGLKKVTTKYAIKLRSDEYYSDLSKFVEKIKNNPEKVITSNFFFSQDDSEPFHPSDHVIGGTTENLLSMFNYAFKVCRKELGSIALSSNYFNIPDWRNRDGNRKVSPETFLCFCYLLSKGVKLDLSKSKEIMKKH